MKIDLCKRCEGAPADYRDVAFRGRAKWHFGIVGVPIYKSALTFRAWCGVDVPVERREL